MKDKLKKLLDLALKALAAVRDSALWAFMGKKLIVIAVGLVLGSIKAKFPEAPLPNQDLLVELVMAFLGCHTLTDVVAILKGASAQKLVAEGLTAALVKFKAGDHGAAVGLLEDLVKGLK